MQLLRTRYYLPGLISALLLPLCCLTYLWRQGAFHQYRMLPVCYFSAAQYNSKSPIIFTKYPVRQYTDYTLTGPAAANTAAFQHIQTTLHQTISSQDTFHGVHIRLDAKTTYGAYVKTLDIFKQEKLRTYQTRPKEIWAWYERPDPNLNAIPFFPLCGSPEQYWREIRAQEKKAVQAEAAVTYRRWLWAFWPVWSLFMLLSVPASKTWRRTPKVMAGLAMMLVVKS